MNRHERRASAKQVTLGGNAPAASPHTGPLPQRPSFALRLFARILLAKWILKRVNHPDVVAILMQIAQQVGRTDAIALLTLKAYGPSR